MNKFIFKKITLVLLFTIVIILIIFSVIDRNQSKKVVIPIPPITQSSEYCYYRGIDTVSGFKDVAWIKIKENNNEISGELRNLPAETDSKVGLFSGMIIESDTPHGFKKANVIWDTFAEGMNTKEELIFDYNENYAIVYFGELNDRGDGVYVFKDKNNLYPQEKMTPINCQDLDEKLLVEEYVRENIKNISITKEVLGGIWYVTKIEIDSQLDSGMVEYEDGHVMEKASFEYDYAPESKTVIIKNFKQL